MLIGAYVLSGLLEIVGIGLVVLDVRGDRSRARDLLDEQRPDYVPSKEMARASINLQLDEQAIRQNPSGMEAQGIYRRRAQEAERDLRRQQQIASGSARAEAELLRAIADMLAGKSLFRRLIGPVLVMIGIVVGTAANLAAM
jgi:hypothetical protein